MTMLAPARNATLSVVPFPAADVEARSRAACPLAPWQMRRVIAHIEENVASLIRIQDLADIARLSTGYFSRAFKQTFGVSPNGYIQSRRVAHAQELMLASRANLSQIALESGFCDQAHLSRRFRAVTGVTPNAWRRHARRAAA